MKPRPYLQRGDRVLMLDARHFHCFKDRKLPIWGRVTSINGGYIYVRPSWCKRAQTFECYDNEIVREDKVTKTMIRRYSQRPRRPQWLFIT